MTHTTTRLLALGAVAVLTGGLLTSPAFAQVYRIVGPDGKVSFSDKPPVDAGSARAVTPGGGSGGSSGGALPFELRQIASKYPVTLYTGENCGPCGSARSMLIARGVPFAERTVSSAEDAQALQRLSGEANLPFATIGSQQLKGYSDSEWNQFLDAAGYPKTSMLPANFRRAAATPLVTVAPAVAAQPAAPARPAPAPTPAVPPPSADNPAGIKF